MELININMIFDLSGRCNDISGLSRSVSGL